MSEKGQWRMVGIIMLGVPITLLLSYIFYIIFF